MHPRSEGIGGQDMPRAYLPGIPAGKTGRSLGGDQGLPLRTLTSAIPGLGSLGFHNGSALQAPPVKYAGGSTPDRLLAESKVRRLGGSANADGA
jgi:hypothetical protein